MGQVEDHPDVPRELAFAPKELRLANDLSERLGYTTVRSPSRSRPTGLSRGHRSVSESDQRRALMLPQELMRLPPHELIVLKAGLPPVRARKIVYHREPAFARRVRPPPTIPAVPAHADVPDADFAEPSSPATPAPGSEALTLAAIAPMLEAENLEPLPPAGASPEAVEAWVERFIDASARLPEGDPRHGR